MFEVIDVVVAAFAATACGWIIYSSNQKLCNNTNPDLTDKQKRVKQRLEKKEPWEHAAEACACGLTLFSALVFNAATNLSHFPILPRLIVTIACFIALFFALRSITRGIFRLYRGAK